MDMKTITMRQRIGLTAIGVVLVGVGGYLLPVAASSALQDPGSDSTSPTGLPQAEEDTSEADLFADDDTATPVDRAALESGEFQGAKTDIADELIDIVDPTQGGKRVTGDGKWYGYAGMVSARSRPLTVYWVGPVPSNITKLFSSEVAAVRVVPAKYTLFEQGEAAEEIMDAAGSPELKGIVTYLIAPIPGGGLSVDYEDPSGDLTEEEIASALAEIAGMPVSVQPGGEIIWQ